MGRHANRRLAAAFRWLLGLLIATLPLPVLALNLNSTLTQYMHSEWHGEQGLPQNTVRAITQGPKGYLWVGTYEGVVLFDGLSFRSFTPRSGPRFQKTINGLVTGPDGTVWVGTEAGGLYAVSPDETVRQWDKNTGLPSNRITALVNGPTGDLWFAAGDQVFQFDDNGPVRVDGLPDFEHRVRALFVDARETLWIGTTGAGLYSWRDNLLRQYTVDDGLGSDRITSITSDAKGGFWLGTFDGVFRYSNGTISAAPWAGAQAAVRVQNLLQEAGGALWIGTYGGGLQRWFDGRISVFSADQGLRNDYLQALYFDREGNFWFGTSDGLNRFREGSGKTFSVSEGLPARFVRSVMVDQAGDAWVGIDGGGLSRIHDGHVDLTLDESDGLLSADIRSLLPDGSGGFWIGAFGGGVNRWTNQRLQPGNLPGGPPSKLIRALFRDSRGSLWVATNDAGVGRYDAHGARVFTTADGLPVNDIRALAEFGGKIWLGTRGGGVVVLDQDQVVARYTIADGLASDAVFTFFSDSKDLLWAGTAAGLSLFEGGKWRSFGEAVTTQAVFQILKDNNGSFWLCANRGIARVDPEQLKSAPPGQSVDVRTFGTLDGMRSVQCNGATQPVASRGPDGRLWFPTLDGVVVFDPDRIRVNPVPPQVSIESVIVEGVAAPWVGNGTLNLAAGTHSVEIAFNGLDLSLPERVRFRYQLLGLGDNWIESGSRRRAYFTNLYPGHYEFRVMAANGDRIWSEKPALVRFYIKPHYYETVWFGSLLVFFGLLLLYAAYRWRVSSLNRSRLALELRVQERTRDLHSVNEDMKHTLGELRLSQEQLVRSERMAAMGGLVAGIAHQLNTPLGNSTTVTTLLRDEYLAMSKELEKGEVASARFARFLEKSRSGLDLLLNDLERSTNLVRKFRRLSAEEHTAQASSFDLATLLMELDGIFGLRIRRAGHQWQLSYPEGVQLRGYRLALTEVLDHLVANALKHAFKSPGGNIELSVTMDNEDVCLRFQDDGRGIPAGQMNRVFEPFSGTLDGPGLGLYLVHNLVTVLMGGRVKCESLSGGGACFVIRLPRTEGANQR